MKILVVGANGKTGRAVVEQALAAGHQVTAFGRNADDLQIKNVRVVEGDTTVVRTWTRQWLVRML